MFLPGESQGRGACWAAVYGVAQSWTRLKRRSSGTVVECRQFNLMVIIYIWGVQFVKYIYFHYLFNPHNRNVR